MSRQYGPIEQHGCLRGGGEPGGFHCGGIASEQTSNPHGTLRLSAPTSFGILHLNEAIPRYIKQHPRVQEGFVVENVLNTVPPGTAAYFYRTSAGAEVDLVFDLPGQERWVIEIKRSTAPRIDKGFYHAYEDLKPDAAFVVYPGDECYPIRNNIEAVNLGSLMSRLT